jgi:hypothetical protein
MLTGPTVYGGPVVQWWPAEPGPVVTHESYLAGVRDAVLAWANGSLPAAKRIDLAETKMVYGMGLGQSARGMTVYGTWQNGRRHDFIEVCAAGEESDLQLAGTTIHELGHVLAGHGAGHSKVWKDACAVLGLTADAAGQDYQVSAFEPTLWASIARIPLPTDGRPVLRGGFGLGPALAPPAPCPLGVGTKGGTSRGKGSGSRLRLFHCECTPPVKARVARDEFDATCNHCGSSFKRAEKG